MTGFASVITLSVAVMSSWASPATLGVIAPYDQEGALVSAGAAEDATPRPTGDRTSRGSRRPPLPADTATPAATATPVSTSTARPTPTPTRTTARPTPTPVIPKSGSGQFATAAGGTQQFGSGPLIRYRVEVEDDLPFDTGEVAERVDQTLSDGRSWAAAGLATFQRVHEGPVDLRIVVATPDTTDLLCKPLDTLGTLSCRMDDRVTINGMRWASGAPAYDGDLAGYRAYVVNHEVGHALGKGHVGCPAAGAPAPVMMQQTKGIGDCRANPWPLPSEL